MMMSEYYIGSDYIFVSGKIFLKNALLGVTEAGEISEILPEDTNSSVDPTRILKMPRGSVLLPGFINSHCHLELSDLEECIPPGQEYSQWVQKQGVIRKNWSLEKYEKSFAKGLESGIQSGTTLIVDLSNYGICPIPSEKIKPDVISFHELLGWSPDRYQPTIHHFQKKFRQGEVVAVPTPHSPYSCSPELIKQCFFNKASGFYTMHLAESQEEKDLFLGTPGPLTELLRFFVGKNPLEGAVGEGIQRYFENEELLFPRMLWAHGNTLNNSEQNFFLKGNSYFVHCPRSHDYFQHPIPDFVSNPDRWLFGTDSLASNSSLSLWDELVFFNHKIRQPWSELELLEMVTSRSAVALGLESEVGKIAKGYRANLQCVLLENSEFSENQILSNLLKKTPEVYEIWMKGRPYYHRKSL